MYGCSEMCVCVCVCACFKVNVRKCECFCLIAEGRMCVYVHGIRSVCDCDCVSLNVYVLTYI